MDEIPSLLAAQQPLKVKLGALDILKGLTGNASSVVHITSCKPVMDILWNSLADGEKEVAVSAAECLVNITSHSESYTPDEEFFPNLLQLFHNPAATHLYNPVAMLINNTTRTTEKATEFSDLIYAADCQHFLKLLGEKKEKGYLAAIMGNLALADKGRSLLMEEEIFAQIMSLLCYPGNIIIRRNTARLLRNLSFDVTTHDRIVKFLPELVLPLCGGEDIDDEDMDKLPLELQYLPEDTRREPDLQTRILLSDMLFQLGGTYSVREEYRKGNYYCVLKNYDAWEDNLDARERIQNVIYLIVQDDSEVDLRREGELPSEVEVETGEADLRKPEDQGISDKPLVQILGDQLTGWAT